MADNLEKFTTLIEATSELCEAGDATHFAKKFKAHERRALLEFIDDPDAEVDERFIGAFKRVVDAFGDKISLRLLEVVLKIGINFASSEDDSFWFKIFECNNYGNSFDQPEICHILLEEVLLLNGNSWKAACLLCILLQDYSSSKRHIISQMATDKKKFKDYFAQVKDCGAFVYLLEVLSNLNSPKLVAEVLPKSIQLKQQQFARDLVDCAVSHPKLTNIVFVFKTFKTEKFQSTSSLCQLYNDFFLVLVYYEDSLAAIQVDYTIISSLQCNSNILRFHLDQPPKVSMPIENIHGIVDLVFTSSNDAKSVFNGLNLVIKKVPTSTPRKISVVESYIKISPGEQEVNGEGTSTLSELIECSSPLGQMKHISDPIPSDGTSNIQEEDEETVFMDNTTKDTSASKNGKTISRVVAESKVRQESIQPTSKATMQSLKPSVVELPDSLDLALVELDKSKHIPDQHPVKAAVVTKPKPAVKPRRGKKVVKSIPDEDIWDFDSSAGAATGKAMTILSSLKKKAKASKTTEKKSYPVNKAAVAAPKIATITAKKNKFQEKLENVDLHNDHDKATKDLIVPSTGNSHIIANDTFSGLTSPVLTMHDRAASRAASTAAKANLTNQADDGYSSDTVVTKKRRAKVLDDDSYNPSQDAAAPEEKRSKPVPPVQKRMLRPQRAAASDKSINDENREQLPRAPAKRMSLDEVFNEDPKPSCNKIEKAAPKKTSAPTTSKSKTVAAVTTPQISATAAVSTGPVKKAAALPSTHRRVVPSQIHYVNATEMLSEAYTNKLQREIFDSINNFSGQLIRKVQIIEAEMNKTVFEELSKKYERLFGELKESFEQDVSGVVDMVKDVEKLLALDEEELMKYISRRKHML